MVKEFSFNGNRIRVEDGWIYAADISSIMTGYTTNVAHLTARLSSEDMRRGYRNAVLINESGFYNMTAGRKHGAELRAFAEENIFKHAVPSAILEENAIAVYSNDQFGELRSIEIDGIIWFAAPDVCRALDISNPSDALTRLDPDEKARFKLGVFLEVNFINECGLYSLILSSRKPGAKAFKRWVTHEVIPSVLKTGSYSVTGNTGTSAIEAVQAFIDDYKALKLQYDQLLTERNELQLQLDNVKKALGLTTNRISSEDPIDYIHRNRKILHNFLNACVRSYTQKRHGTNNFGLGWSDFYTRLQKNLGEDIRLRGEPYIDHITDEEMTAAINVANAMKSPKLQIEDATMTVVQKVLAA